MTTRLEDFGAAGPVTPEERFREYQQRCKTLPRNARARFWLGIMDTDPEVARLKEVRGSNELTRRNRKWSRARRNR